MLKPRNSRLSHYLFWLLQTFAGLLQQFFPCVRLVVTRPGGGGGAGPGTATPAACPAASHCVALGAGCPLLCPQPCRSPSTPTPARSSGLSMKAIATGTSPSTKPGLKLTSIAPSSPLASDQPSWSPSTGEEHRNSSSHPSTVWGKKENGDKVPFPQHILCASCRLPSQPQHPSAPA